MPKLPPAVFSQTTLKLVNKSPPSSPKVEAVGTEEAGEIKAKTRAGEVIGDPVPHVAETPTEEHGVAEVLGEVRKDIRFIRVAAIAPSLRSNVAGLTGFLVARLDGVKTPLHVPGRILSLSNRILTSSRLQR